MKSEEMDDELHRIRHSLAHVLAQAVLELRPGTTLGFGPPIRDGFYYDFVLSSPISEEDFTEIEKKMRHIVKQNQKFEREDLPKEEAIKRIAGVMKEPYKQEYAEELIEKQGLESLSFYKNGPFLDMCEGPHVESTRQLPVNGFKLKSVAGAYWRGDSKKAMMTRIYAWAFKTKEELDAYVKAYHDALARDHKKLGKELEIFVVDEEIGKGLPLWLPNGTVIRDELEKLAKELEFKGGYQRVSTPHLSKANLYHQTGHLPYYAVHMYPLMEIKEKRETEHGEVEEVVETYALKPMNCPHHHRIFASKKRSYRELPLRLAEYGTVYRAEDSGALSGLLRVRGMTMNDAHIYCSEDQIKPEFLAVMELHRKCYEVLGLSDYYLRFSTWDPEDPKGREKYVDNPAAWERTQRFVKEAMIESGMPFTEGKGEAAFYGPKIDVQFRTVTGREETASTNQLDFAVPERLGLTFVGADNTDHLPYVIHRAPLGTHERFVAFLIEHFGGAFPTWLAPVQVRIVTVADRFNDVAEKICAALRSDMVRAELDHSSETMGKKVRNAVTKKIPNVLVIGEREAADGTVTLRRYGVEAQETLGVDAFRDRLRLAIANRSRSL
ncbi:MAG: threonine--tRNA ligase [Deltaproteobacteria bacterium]|nr:threonine--tRNA ligase [Deltaproteobacteria bacterium]